MTTKEKIALLRKRFIHRDDTFVQQWYNSETEKGGYTPVVMGLCAFGCNRKVCPHVERRAPNDRDLIGHLKGTQTMGVYQVRPSDNTVRWLCIDVDADTEEGYALLQEHTKAVVRAAYRLVGNAFLVEWSGSRGYHVWVFFSESVHAAKAQTIGRAIEQTVSPQPSVHIEVYPKQTSVKNFGNLVKIPLGIHKKTGNRSLFINSKFEPYPLEQQWALLADVRLLDEAAVDEIIREHKLTVAETAKKAQDDSSRGYLTLPCMARIMDEGISEGGRDIGAFRLASYLRDRSLNESMTTAAMEQWNVELNRPPLDEQQLLSKVRSAYERKYSPAPCAEAVLDSYCSSSCRLWPNKVNERWRRFGKEPLEAVGVISRD